MADHLDLKVGRFTYAAASQMHLYLNYARGHWMKPDENPPIGLILCSEKGAAEAHYRSTTCQTRSLPPSTRPCWLTTLIAEQPERTRATLESRKLSDESDEDET
ncbi:PDDEXK nuclease domain-containing protein [Paraburkholderia strydomiana]|uniref:PDDEXK nuclease domain-containing protein n=1 Tax=Paraburkholderia strydomiana TaxID=1245417 RepID=UPI0038BDE699